MLYTGSYINKAGQTVRVDIATRAEGDAPVEIGADGGALFFPAEEAVTITAEVNDTFDTLLPHSATVRLLAAGYEPDFFGLTFRDTSVRISVDGSCVFAGYVEPQTYSQPFNELYDELELNCIDALGALQYCRYANAGSAGVDYAAVKAEAGRVTFMELLESIMNEAIGTGARIYYDGSRMTEAGADAYRIFGDMDISELLFLGDDEDSVWTLDKVLGEMLRYLNLHIRQQGTDFYIFDWATPKYCDSVDWGIIYPSGVSTGSRPPRVGTVAISADNVYDTGTSMDMSEVFNRISVSCPRRNVEQLIQSPLDEDAMTSPYTGRQKYMTEYSSPYGEGDYYSAFITMIKGAEPYANPSATVREWYIRVMSHPDWIFPIGGDTLRDMVTEMCKDNEYQHNLPNFLAGNIGAALLSIGSVEPFGTKDDNTPPSKINMDTSLVISVNGNGRDSDLDYAKPDDAAILKAMPVAGYVGSSTGAVLSPSDDSTTNYLVISGKITLNPLMPVTGPMLTLKTLDTVEKLHEYALSVDGLKPYKDDGKKRLYGRRYWAPRTPTSYPAEDIRLDGFIPFTGEAPKEFKYTYAEAGDKSGVDRISKVPVVACMLIIGDKVLVESDTGTSMTQLRWQTYKPRTVDISDDEYFSQCFFLGINPKIDDCLIGQEYDIASNIYYYMGLDAEGMAIPIRHEDGLSGPVRFMVLGPVNTTWDEVTRRHRTWFRREKWSTSTHAVLARVSNIIVKNLNIEVVTDNGHIDLLEDNDIVYVSDTDERYVNPKDDIEMPISSDLTGAERQALGVSAGVNLGTPTNLDTGYSMLTVYDCNTGNEAKPEQLYVDAYWREYHRPRLLLTQTLRDGSHVSYTTRYTHPALPGRTFYPIGISRDLSAASSTLTLKEVDYD
ncbi:MAG: hypothetical protein NC193_09955 [bacterium]|nr:hypothetical protein [bacterium]